MRRLFLALCLCAPIAAHAQAPRSAQSAFAAALAENLSAAYAQIDALNAQVADLQRKLDAATKSEPLK